MDSAVETERLRARVAMLESAVRDAQTECQRMADENCALREQLARSVPVEDIDLITNPHALAALRRETDA